MIKQKKYTLYYYQSISSGLWYWRMLGPHKTKLFESSNGYTTKTGLLRAIKKVKVLDFDYVLVRTAGVPELKEDFILK